MTENKYMPGKEVQDALDRLMMITYPASLCSLTFIARQILDVPELTKGGVSFTYDRGYKDGKPRP